MPAAMLALYGLLLHRYSGRTDITVAVSADRDGDHWTPAASSSEGDGTYLIRLDLAADRSFSHLVDAVRAAVIEPADADGAAASPQFTYGRVADPAPAHQGAVGSGAVLELILLQDGDQVTGHLVFAPDVFDEATAWRAVGHLLTLAEGVREHPDRPVEALNMLTAEEASVFDALNRISVTPGSRTFHELFEAQAERTPKRTAVRAEDGELTFRQLNRRSNQLAHLLRERGVGPGTAVGIRADRDTRTVAALLAVLKAGGAYVPVDVREPASRREAILRDAGVVAEIVTAAGDPAPESASGPPAIVLDADWSVVDGRPAHNPPVSPSALTDAAYLLYTSGTTGLPKGVVVENRHLVSYVQAILTRLDIDTPMKWAVVQPLSVDSSVTALMPPLCTGGEAQLLSRERSVDPDAFADWALRWGIDCLKIAPSHLRSLQSSPRFGELFPRKRLVVGCEASDWQWLRELQRENPDCRVFNHYGPTETTVGALTLTVSDCLEGDWDTAPIGFPLPNAQVHVVDAAGRPVPAGVAGEIAIGGHGVARGYHGRDDLNTQAFMPDTLCGEPTERVYRTGDFGRRFPDGMIAFLGRRDDQVKLRGFRIALGEIDAVLRSHPEVRNAVTVLREDAPGERRLAAYVEPHTRASFRVSALDDRLRERLPAHMIPQVVVMDALPLAGNGKVSRAALPPPPAPAAGTAVPSSGRWEQLVAEVWRTVLNTEVSGIDQNFFDAGGHSLMLVTLQQGLQRASDRSVSMLDLFTYATVRSQAELLKSSDQAAVPAEPVRRHSEQQNALLKRRNEQLRARRSRS
ncbi:amino acid adenylation domain-containing protein [Streptomyces sp. ADMS]|uniref:non-ribosomal peptide synthetase n=1 Tax=Streptomyces sp. ADMS TaxID=3071415 RepID=UPI00296F9B05|nr:amino acid adenylation domain-containing protein [Streptomyces sp. ADMS]MDW4910062.1 amino acid adenylation domain-containing protein [Streptomyces sp. ADMS]